MKNVRILNEESEGTGTAKVDVVLDGGKTLTVRNCHLVPRVYFGNVMLKDGDGVESEVAAYLFIHEDGSARITL